MKKIIKKIFFIGLIIFLLMQLYQPARNESYEQELTANFTKMYYVPKNVENIGAVPVAFILSTKTSLPANFTGW